MAERTIPATREETAPQERETTRAQEQYIAPPVDIFEDNDGLTVLADMPGVEPGDLDVRVEQGVLTLQAKPKHAFNEEPYYQEYRLVNFFRQFQLSEEVDVEKISAELKNGVLNLRLPKAEKAKPKKIQVRST
ncbi:MAG: Hsp20/alpha crystallin family protein [Dehalococcoidales bacterium]|nr:Hsp20/alpha crystallin family protein [Dehalococcoidales bacterium]